jgi:hypothetical protein
MSPAIAIAAHLQRLLSLQFSAIAIAAVHVLKIIPRYIVISCMHAHQLKLFAILH